MKKRQPNHEESARRIALAVRRSSRTKRQKDRMREINASAAMLQRHANMLAEHFSNIQIVASKVESNGHTSDYSAGSGDLHARVHLVGVWADRIEGMYREGM